MPATQMTNEHGRSQMANEEGVSNNSRLEVPAPARKWSNDDLAFALENAAEFLENEEWPEEDGGAQVVANQEAAKRIRRMAKRVTVLGSSERHHGR